MSMRETTSTVAGNWWQVVLGRIAAIAQHANRPRGELGRDKVHDLAGQGTAGLIGHVQLAAPAPL